MDTNEQGSSGGTVDKAMRNLESKSPDELRQRAKERVAKATAASAGAMEGFADQSNPHALGEATRKIGETMREVATGVKEEAGKGTGPSVSEGPGVGDRLSAKREEMVGKGRERAQQTMRSVAEQARKPVDHIREDMKTQSPEEIRETARREIGGAMGTATGAVEGYAEQADPKAAGQAAKKLVQSGREVVKQAKKETRKTRDELQGSSSGGASTAEALPPTSSAYYGTGERRDL